MSPALAAVRWVDCASGRLPSAEGAPVLLSGGSPPPLSHAQWWRVPLKLGALGPLSAGQLEVILDRRLMQDDNRGLGQGLKDNKLTCNRFRLLLERRATASKVRLREGGLAW